MGSVFNQKYGIMFIKKNTILSVKRMQEGQWLIQINTSRLFHSLLHQGSQFFGGNSKIEENGRRIQRLKQYYIHVGSEQVRLGEIYKLLQKEITFSLAFKLVLRKVRESRQSSVLDLQKLITCEPTDEFQLKCQCIIKCCSKSIKSIAKALLLIEYQYIYNIIYIFTFSFQKDQKDFQIIKKFVLLKMVLGKFVEVGRVVKINYGPQEGKLATIVEILNDKRVLIDGPTTGVQRQVIPIRRLTLTKINSQRTGVITKAIKKSDPFAQYAQTIAAKKVAKKALRAKLNDFDRFRVMILRKRRSALLSTQLKSLKKNTGGKAQTQAKGGNKKK
ncbi:unnamed protein product (macronuclear) [Paramecium tetraurelia]|uniref:KOW domain-containing protein n=1 Tax=Paramecium tetraurelia TaxID=5888 RepID=A0DIQ7_PARTE|nr:uncharacterized protein GSPATT00017281001 [Paramecium tetraurelia]CAK82924.1 unnamed protein product [Paramecium tetraurelia]|eukprot:XP_001450321.1 hypothetical protein (macronuclear) [Paramecium tetraurelia strain d4-2]